jgi:hypothetical protein
VPAAIGSPADCRKAARLLDRQTIEDVADVGPQHHARVVLGSALCHAHGSLRASLGRSPPQASAIAISGRQFVDGLVARALG